MEANYKVYIERNEALLRRRLSKAGVTVSKSDGLLHVVSVGFDYMGWPQPDFGKGSYGDYAGCISRLLQALGSSTKKKEKKGRKRRQHKKKLERRKSDSFLQGYEWRKVRYGALKANDGRCECCGRSKHDGVVLNVDHIKPRKKYPEMALDPNNLQVLCGACNHGKGNWDETDWREPSLKTLMGEGVE